MARYYIYHYIFQLSFDSLADLSRTKQNAIDNLTRKPVRMNLIFYLSNVMPVHRSVPSDMSHRLMSAHINLRDRARKKKKSHFALVPLSPWNGDPSGGGMTSSRKAHHLHSSDTALCDVTVRSRDCTKSAPWPVVWCMIRAVDHISAWFLLNHNRF